MHSFKSFFYFLHEYQNESKELSKCSRFSRCGSNTNNDLTSYCKRRVCEEILENELKGLIEENKIKGWEILINSYHVEKNRIFLKLARSSFTKAILDEIYKQQSGFGSTTIFNGKKYNVCCSPCGRGLTYLRLTTAARVVASLIKNGGGEVTNEPSYGVKTVCLSSSSVPSRTNDHFILVNKATMADGDDITEKAFNLLRREDMLAMGDHKDVSESSVNKMVDAAITFDLLSVKLEKPVVLDSSSQPNSARKSNSRGAPFVLYNYARLCAILDRYALCISKGIYQPLPPVQDVNYDLLSSGDEWSLVFDFLVEWPTVIAECQDLDQPKLHKMIGFLSSFASTFSVYYRHTRVLNEGLAHMVPIMEARIHLLTAIRLVFLSAFSILGIDAPTAM